MFSVLYCKYNEYWCEFHQIKSVFQPAALPLKFAKPARKALIMRLELPHDIICLQKKTSQKSASGPFCETLLKRFNFNNLVLSGVILDAVLHLLCRKDFRLERNHLCPVMISGGNNPGIFQIKTDLYLIGTSCCQLSGEVII